MKKIMICILSLSMVQVVVPMFAPSRLLLLRSAHQYQKATYHHKISIEGTHFWSAMFLAGAFYWDRQKEDYKLGLDGKLTNMNYELQQLHSILTKFYEKESDLIPLLGD